MTLDPESAWRAPGDERYILQKQDSAFINLPSNLDSRYAKIARTVVTEFGLKPFRWVGLERIAPSQAVNVHREALGDLYKCQVVVSILSPDTQTELDWIFSEISARHGWGVAVLAYELRDNKNTDRASKHRSLVPSDVKIQIIEASALGDVLRNDLSVLSSR
jgi:hypothetical protein